MPGLEYRPLFVFGTLRRGKMNHHLLAGAYERFLPAKLKGFERFQPLMIRRRSGHVVRGEVFYIHPELYEETMRRCDILEEIPPGKSAGWLYRRAVVRIQSSAGPVEAWAYIQAHSMVP